MSETGGEVAQRRDSNPRSPIVIPSSDLDAHLHTMASQIAKRRHSKQNDVMITTPQACSSGDHDDDLMTPPNVLLERALKEAERYTTEDDKDAAVREWTKCTALARIVYGDSHWMFAHTHIHLGKSYQSNGLLEQALMHATKGRDILLAPGGHVMSHDPPPEAVHSLSMAHCIIGSVLTERGRLAEAEKTLLKAEKCSERLSKLPGNNADVQLDLDIVSSMGRMCLKQGKPKLAKDCFLKAVDLSKAAFGATNGRLVPLLRGLATAQLQMSEQPEALETLEEALRVAKENYGEDSEPVAEVLMGQARAQPVAGEDMPETGSVEEILTKAHSIYSSLYGPNSEKAIACKEELCRVLSSNKDKQKKAIPLVRELIAAKRHTYGDQSVEVAQSLKLLGTLYLMQGNVPQARKQLEKARAAFSYSLGAKHKETCHITKTLEIIAGSASLPLKNLQSTKPLFKTVV